METKLPEPISLPIIFKLMCELFKHVYGID